VEAPASISIYIYFHREKLHGQQIMSFIGWDGCQWTFPEMIKECNQSLFQYIILRPSNWDVWFREFLQAQMALLQIPCGGAMSFFANDVDFSSSTNHWGLFMAPRILKSFRGYEIIPSYHYIRFYGATERRVAYSVLNQLQTYAGKGKKDW
jgi:hypothetical protein